jgi:hypothetical protein
MHSMRVQTMRESNWVVPISLFWKDRTNPTSWDNIPSWGLFVLEWIEGDWRGLNTLLYKFL